MKQVEQLVLVIQFGFQEGSRWYWAYDAISIRVDKPEYEIGETARFVVQSPIEDAHILLTHEGESLESAELIKIEGTASNL